MILFLKKLFSVNGVSRFASVALLLLRLVVGLAFVYHGMGKIQNPFTWMGPEATTPAALQALAAVAEFGGGMALVLGFFTPLASLGILSTMTVAVHLLMVIMKKPFVTMEGGSYELPLLYWAVVLVVMAVGPGSLSLDRAFFGKKRA